MAVPDSGVGRGAGRLLVAVYAVFALSASSRDGLQIETELDLAEGADAVMVKPAMAYLDVVRAVADAVDVPVAAYQVSGEYAMVEAAAAQRWVDRRRIVLETLTGIRRAGAGMVLTYWATEAAGWLAGQ